MRSEMCWMRLAGNTGRKNDAKKSPSAHHRTALSGCIFATKHVSTIGKSFLNSNISATCLHNMANFGPLAAEIGSGVLGTPANFDGFRVLASLVATSFTGGQSNFARCLAALLGCYIIYTLSAALAPLTEFRHVQNSLCAQVLCSPILAALLHGSRATGSAKLCDVVQGMELRDYGRERHLYSAGRPSRWASAHIVVIMPLHSTTYVDAVYCYRLSSVVCWSVCLSVTIVSPAKPMGCGLRLVKGNKC